MIGGFSDVPYMAGSLTASANSTLWTGAAAVFNGFTMADVLIPVIVVAVAIVAILGVIMTLAGREASLASY